VLTRDPHSADPQPRPASAIVKPVAVSTGKNAMPVVTTPGLAMAVATTSTHPGTPSLRPSAPRPPRHLVPLFRGIRNFEDLEAFSMEVINCHWRAEFANGGLIIPDSFLQEAWDRLYYFLLFSIFRPTKRRGATETQSEFGRWEMLLSLIEKVLSGGAMTERGDDLAKGGVAAISNPISKATSTGLEDVNIEKYGTLLLRRVPHVWDDVLLVMRKVYVQCGSQ